MLRVRHGVDARAAPHGSTVLIEARWVLEVEADERGEVAALQRGMAAPTMRAMVVGRPLLDP